MRLISFTQLAGNIQPQAGAVVIFEIATRRVVIRLGQPAGVSHIEIFGSDTGRSVNTNRFVVAGS